jgi:ubiquinone/menaquinone biosynthesis C-methylase UbiE
MSTEAKTLKNVQDYYGKVLAQSSDLKTNACCSTEAIASSHKGILSQIEDEVLSKFYGCGTPLPPALEGRTVLDLGCGTGRDAFLLSKLVGPTGSVIGVDMTDEQLEVARRNLDKQMKRFGFDKPNVDFRKGYIEDLAAVGLEDNSVDVVVSNCVINLSPDKRRVFSEIFRVLKPGGELYFSDVYADRRIPESLRNDKVLYGECLSGAMYTEDFRRLLAELGCLDSRVVSQSPITISNPEIEDAVGLISFSSITVRAFKLASVEDRCEDYGQVATYNGGLGDDPHTFLLDNHHLFERNRPMLVCGNTAAMLEETRYSKYFDVTPRKEHFGLFDCGDVTIIAHEQEPEREPSACC